MNYKRRANKLVKKFAAEMGVIPPLAKAATVTYLTYTIENVKFNPTLDEAQKRLIIDDYTKTLNALNETVNTDLLCAE